MCDLAPPSSRVEAAVLYLARFFAGEVGGGKASSRCRVRVQETRSGPSSLWPCERARSFRCGDSEPVPASLAPSCPRSFPALASLASVWMTDPLALLFHLKHLSVFIFIRAQPASLLSTRIVSTAQT